MVKTEIRQSTPGDWAAIERLYPDAFPDEDLLPLVGELLQEPSGVYSLVATVDGAIVGNIIFTICGVGNSEVAMLAPLGIASAFQRQGIGSSLVQAGLEQMKNAGQARVCVLGDPAYYGRLGFTREDDIIPPYPVPDEWRDAWQSIGLSATNPPQIGNLRVPGPWQHPALWAP